MTQRLGVVPLRAPTRAPRPPARAWYGLLTRHRFRAMNTDVLIAQAGPPDAPALAEAERLVRALEARFSRFRDDSELCALNRRAGSTLVVSDEMLRILTLAVDLNRRTGGMFEPAVLPQLEAAGYDRSFELVERDRARAPTVAAPRRTHSIAGFAIDAARRAVRAPAGARIDLGGIGKGFIVDETLRLMEPLADVLVDAGGDVRAIGGGPDGGGWLVAVGDPSDPSKHVSLVRLRDAALATSTTAIRRWRRGGRWFNHIIDPRTGAPTTSDVVSATVYADTAVEADVLAKCALVLGPDEGGDLLRAQRAEGLFVLTGGRVHHTPGWPGTPPKDHATGA